jgi:hypothetical protein
LFAGIFSSHFAHWGYKMKLVSLVEGLIIKLSVIPGLGFLSSYVTELHGRKTHMNQMVQMYTGYVRTAREAAGDVNQAVRGSQKDEESDEGAIDEEYDDDDESYLQ